MRGVKAMESSLADRLGYTGGLKVGLNGDYSGAQGCDPGERSVGVWLFSDKGDGDTLGPPCLLTEGVSLPDAAG